MVLKADGKWRPCGDSWRLNNISVHDRYPVPHIQDFSVHLAGATFFSKVDLVRGYHQVPVHPPDVPKTVITPFGLFEFLRMPFGLKGAAQTFQRLMDCEVCHLRSCISMTSSWPAHWRRTIWDISVFKRLSDSTSMG